MGVTSVASSNCFSSCAALNQAPDAGCTCVQALATITTLEADKTQALSQLSADKQAWQAEVKALQNNSDAMMNAWQAKMKQLQAEMQQVQEGYEVEKQQHAAAVADVADLRREVGGLEQQLKDADLGRKKVEEQLAGAQSTVAARGSDIDRWAMQQGLATGMYICAIGMYAALQNTVMYSVIRWGV